MAIQMFKNDIFFILLHRKNNRTPTNNILKPYLYNIY